MKRIFLLVPLPLLALFVACATSDDPGGAPPGEDGGARDASMPETEPPTDASDAGADADAEALRCSGEFCLLDLPNPGVYGFTKWVFAGVQVDPALGAWAIANGVLGIDQTTGQMLHFEDDAWKAKHAPVLGSGAEERSLRLSSLATNGAGKLLAVGSALDDGSGVFVQGDGTSFTSESSDVALEAVWFAGPDEAWGAGFGGTVAHFTPDGGWVSETIDEESRGDFVSVWGTGPDDVYVGGSKEIEFVAYGYLGHRTIEDGAASWTFSTFQELQPRPFGDHVIRAGIALADGPRFWAAPDVLARAATDGGEQVWEADPFKPPVGLNAFWARAKDDIWAVGNIGRIYHFDGTTWKDVRLVFNGAPLVANLTGIAGTSAGELFIVGDGVALRRKAP